MLQLRIHCKIGTKLANENPDSADGSKTAVYERFENVSTTLAILFNYF
jgi:hypothetical protein